MSGQQQLSPCAIGLNEAWARFPACNYDRILVFVALITPQQELMLAEDEEGNWGLPYERFLMRDMLRAVPERVFARKLGLDPGQVGADFSKIRLLGTCDIGRDHCVVLSMPIGHPIRRPKWRYVAGTALQPYAEQQQIITPLAAKLWPQAMAMN